MLLLATEHGLIFCDREGENWRVAPRVLADRRLTSVIAREGVILAGTTEGVFRSDDMGQTWPEANEGLSSRHIRWLAHHPDISNLEFAGTEPAAIFVSRDGGERWRNCPEVTALRELHGWSLPYSSEAGCVRGFAFQGSRAYAAVEVGGVLRSDDNAETWQLAKGSDGNPDLDGPPEPFIYPDVHSISVQARTPDLVLAPTGGGFYRSTDGGATWVLLYDCYCRAVWVDPVDAQRMILGPADGVDKNGRIEMTADSGRTWIPASAGLKVPWRNTMVERFTQVEDELLAVLSNGHLLGAPLSTLEWRRILPDVPGIAAVAPAVK
jgi:photosystem II stability/assembly factor-like uncharacterized protein